MGDTRQKRTGRAGMASSLVGLLILLLFLTTSCTKPVQKPNKWPIIKAPAIVRTSPEQLEEEKVAREEKLQQAMETEKEAERLRLEAMPKVTAEFFGDDIKDVLQAFSDETGVPIAYDAIVEGEVFAKFQQVPLELALDRVLFSGGFDFALDGDTYFVTNPDPRNNFNALRIYRTETFRTYLPAGQIVERLNTNFRQFVGFDDARPHLITISAPSRMLKQIKTSIREMDQFLQQVVIEVLVIDVSFTRAYDIGNELGTLNLDAGGVVDLANGVKTAYTSTIMGNILSTIQYLWQHGAVDLRANPKIVTLDGQEATIDVSIEQRFPILTGNVSFPQIFIETISVGTVLRVTPFLLPDGYIQMSVNPEISDVVGQTSSGSGIGGQQQTLPIVSRRTVNSTLKVRLGETIIIGGLRNTFLSEKDVGVPGLSYIPIVNFAFNNKEMQQETREMLVLLTPRLAEGGIQDTQFPLIEERGGVKMEGK